MLVATSHTSSTMRAALTPTFEKSFMNHLYRSCALLALMYGGACFAQTGDFQVADIFPGNKTQDVELEPLIQVHVSDKFDPATVSDDAVQLFRLRGERVKVNVGGDLGGVVTLSVLQPLRTSTEYELRVTKQLKNLAGKSIKPLTVRFRTTDKPMGPPRDDIADFRFAKTRIERRDGVCGLAIAGDQLFACTWDGKLIGYSLRTMDRLLGRRPNC